MLVIDATRRLASVPTGGVDAGYDMSQPSKENDPKKRRRNEMNESREYPPLDKLAQARNKKADESGDDVSGRSLTHNR
jgi:hypothetical protein